MKNPVNMLAFYLILLFVFTISPSSLVPQTQRSNILNLSAFILYQAFLLGQGGFDLYDAASVQDIDIDARIFLHNSVNYTSVSDGV